MAALALGLSHDAVAVPVHDEGVIIFAPVANSASSNGLNEDRETPKARWTAT